MADFQIGQTRKIYTHVNEQQFKELLQLSPTPNIIIKFSAPWCKPCKKIKDVCDSCFAKLPESVVIADINIDETMDLYGTLKRKRMVYGIPTILYYSAAERQPAWFIPSDSVSGGDEKEVIEFFDRCQKDIS